MQNFDHNIGFWEKRQFFAENCRKSQEIVIITSTPELASFSGPSNRQYRGYNYNARNYIRNRAITGLTITNLILTVCSIL
jgi:hypothetical protein